jgi:hypothetical protein
MVVIRDDERQALVDALRVALARAEAMCERAKLARTASQAVRALHVREQIRASRVLSPRGAARLLKDLETAARDLEMLKAKIESSKPPTRTIQLRRRR